MPTAAISLLRYLNLQFVSQALWPSLIQVQVLWPDSYVMWCPSSRSWLDSYVMWSPGSGSWQAASGNSVTIYSSSLGHTKQKLYLLSIFLAELYLSLTQISPFHSYKSSSDSVLLNLIELLRLILTSGSGRAIWQNFFLVRCNVVKLGCTFYLLKTSDFFWWSMWCDSKCISLFWSRKATGSKQRVLVGSIGLRIVLGQVNQSPKIINWVVWVGPWVNQFQPTCKLSHME